MLVGDQVDLGGLAQAPPAAPRRIALEWLSRDPLRRLAEEAIELWLEATGNSPAALGAAAPNLVREQRTERVGD